jgi:hypothetical protein
VPTADWKENPPTFQTAGVIHASDPSKEWLPNRPAIPRHFTHLATNLAQFGLVYARKMLIRTRFDPLLAFLDRAEAADSREIRWVARASVLKSADLVLRP